MEAFKGNKEEAIKYMTSSKSIQQWNDRREEVKQVHGSDWVGANIDAKGIVKKCSFAYKRG